jgi:prefoldin beta subunit
MEQNNNQVQEMQIIEQNLQNILLQKQSFQMELSETERALKEIKSSDEDAYKIIGQLMIKTKKDSIVEDLSNKKKIIDLRLQNLEKQEEAYNKKMEELQKEIFGKQ